ALDRLRQQLVELDRLQSSVRHDLSNLRLAPDLFADTIAINERLVELGLTVDSTEGEFDRLVEHLTVIKNDRAIPEQYRNIATRMLEIANAAVAARSEIAGTTAALRDLGQVNVRGLGVDDALAQIRKLTPE